MFWYMLNFTRTSNQMVMWSPTREMRRKRGMRNITLEGRKPFCALVGFRIPLPFIGYGFKYYGFVCSSEDYGKHKAVISTYISGRETEFRFFLNSDLDVNPVSVRSDTSNQGLVPDVIYPPHLWQKISFFD